MRIIPLSEGSFTIDKSKLFVPFDKLADDLQERARGSLLVEVQPFVVITSEDILLIDAGLGFNDEDGRLQLHSNLMNAGINPSEITKVLMSHLHKDHAGGVEHINEFGERKLSFPSATYYVVLISFFSGMDPAHLLVTPRVPAGRNVSGRCCHW